MFDFLKYNNFPMDGEEGDASTGGAGGGDDGANAPAGDEGDNQGGDDSGEGEPAGDNEPAGGDLGDKAPDNEGEGEPAGDDGGDDKPDDKGEVEAKDEKNWRADYAGDDKKKLAFLNTISSQKALIDKVFAQEKLIRSGGHKEALGDKATDEEVAAFREKNGIPEKSDGYLDALPEGLVIGEDMKDQVEGYLDKMHDMNVSPDIVSQGLQSFQDYQEKFAAQVQTQDLEAQNTAVAELKEEWGADYDANLGTLNNFIEANFPEELHGALKEGRLGDDGGTPLMSDANMMKAFVNIQRQLNPLGTQTSGIGMDQIDGIEDQIKTYEGRMDTKSWFKDQKAQDHYQLLLEQRAKFKA